MNTSKVIALGVGAAVLVGVAYYTAQEEEKVVQSAAAPTTTVQESITSGTIERIEIQTPDTTVPVVLTRKGDDWFTNVEKGYRADKSQVTGILTSLEKDIQGEVVSTNEESFSDYLVDEKNGTRVKIFGQGNSLAGDLIVGKDGGAAFTTYVRKADAKEVVNASESLSVLFKKEPGAWRDKVLLEFGQDTITAVSSEGTSGTYVMQKNGDSWQITKPQQYEVQMPKASSLVSTLGNLRATEFVEVENNETLAGMGLNPPRQKITITHEDRGTSPAKAVQTVLLVGNPRGEGPQASYFVKRSDQPDAALIGEFQAQALSPALADIAVLPPPPSPAPETTGTLATTTGTVESQTETTATAGAQVAPSATTAAEPAPLAAAPAAAEPTPTPAATPAATPVLGAAETASGETTATAAAAPAVPAVTPGVSDDRSTQSDAEETTGPSAARH